MSVPYKVPRSDWRDLSCTPGFDTLWSYHSESVFAVLPYQSVNGLSPKQVPIKLATDCEPSHPPNCTTSTASSPVEDCTAPFNWAHLPGARPPAGPIFEMPKNNFVGATAWKA